MSAYVQTVVGSDSPPIGAVMEFAGSVEPSGWVFCYGQAYPRVGVMAQLFQVIGTTWGVGDGSTTFNVPDFRGRVAAGRDDMGGVAAGRLTSAWGVNGAVLGANGGSESHVLTIPQIPAHTHTETRTSVQGGGNINTAAGTTALSTFSQNTGSAGGDQAHPNVQPTGVVNVIIKYTVSGTVLPIVPGTGDVVGPDGGVADGQLAIFDGTTGKIIKDGGVSVSAVSAMPRGHIYGLQLANNATDATNDIDIALGECRDSANLANIELTSLITKRLDAAWVAGTNQGGLDTGAIANVTYHVHVIKNLTTGVVDVLFSTSPSSPALPVGFTLFRRIGSILRVSAAIKQFVQNGNTFQIISTSDYVSSANRPMALLTLSIPTGVIVFPICHLRVAQATAGFTILSVAAGIDSGIVAGTIAQANLAAGIDSTLVNYCASNTNGQIYFQVNLGGGTLTDATVKTLGWIDDRGQYS